ncbi:beta-1,3-glucanase family protein [Flammeovirga kamogawensis]|uniref:T9SS type A sorting domain-containing protein n=1 Tax=Flammeovirga kamogawensis TaxID=373891 RepID=A0ABX8GZ33_9BACT|nr:beta-1,3-glucanase family protein [Flammeovirga kamogawensis]MBB6459315.1 hypothetical protein [Flammeovirga kamogawensis]QWG08874.1 T9SS type A sorting domain-containing protein [Flammeovirga kamogawensis]TRX67164.1 T9SS type A sorting domain-containing protein [Flammeovirga kamogawensis]
MKNLFYNFTTLIILFLSGHNYAQDAFPVVIENPSEYSNDELYVAIVGEDLSGVPGVHVWVDMKTGEQYPMNKSYNTMPGPVYGGNRNPDQTALYADVFTKLSDIQDQTVLLNPIQGCRIFISVGEPLYLFFHGATGDPSGYSSPNHTDPTDPNKGIPYEIIELTYNQYGFFGNPTRVDSYKIPIGMELFGHDGYQKKVGEVATHEAIVEKFLATAPQEFLGCVNPSTGEITAPSKTKEFADGTIGTLPDVGPYVDYMKPYIDQIWEKYAQEDLIFDSGDAGVWQGRVNGGALELHSISTAFEGRSGIVVRKPTTQEVFEGKGVLDNVVQDHTTDLLVQAQLCAAINRHVVDVSTPNVGLQDWSKEEDYYQEFPYNFYAAFWHDRSISLDGLSYGFAYDDVWNYSPSVHTPSPSLLKISFGGYLNATSDTLTSIVINNAIDSLNLNEVHDYAIDAFNQNNEAMTIYATWSSTGGTIENNGAFSASEEGVYTITASKDGVQNSTNVVVYYDSTNVIIPDDGICSGTPVNNDYTYKIEEAGATYTITLLPNREGVASQTAILFYGVNTTSGLSGNLVQANVPYDIIASEGDQLNFYYTYNVPEGGERNTADDIHSVTLGACSSVIIDPPFTLETPVANVTSITQNTANLNWTDVNAETYQVVLNGSIVATTTALSYTFNNLTSSTNYAVEVIASANGESKSASVSFSTVEDEVVPPTSNCNGVAVNGDYAYEISNDAENPTLTFIPGRNGVGNNIIILYYSTSSLGNKGGNIITPNTPYQLTANINDQVDFYFTYSVPEGGERNSAATPHQFEVGSCGPVIPDTEAPSAVTNLQSTNVTHNSFTLSWNPSTDNRGVEGYNIAMNGITITTSATSFTFEDLSPLTSYAVSVQAKDVSGLFSVATIHNVTTLVEPEIPESEFTCEGDAGFTTAGTVDYFYTVAYEGNNVIIGFEPQRNGVGSSTRLLIVNGAGYHMDNDGDGTYSYTVQNTSSVDFYFVYNVPEGGERNGSTQRHICNSSNARVQTLNLENEIALNVYPNPSDHFVNISIDSDNEVALQLLNTNGSVLINDTFNRKTQLDISTLPKGMYLINIQNSTFNKTLKWIKK